MATASIRTIAHDSTQNSSFSKIIESPDTIIASTVFQEDALLAAVEIERGDPDDEK